MNSDRFNPILVRELRQMVRSRMIVWIINLYLLGMVAFIGYDLISYIEGLSSRETFGRELFTGIAIATSIATSLAVIGYTALRVSVDRVNEDLLFYTTLRPGQNVRGRFVCGLVLSLLFFSLSAPFWVLAYMFRGVDLWMYAVFIPLPFVLIQIANLIALAVFSAVRSWFQWIFYALLYVAILILLGFFCLQTFEIFGRATIHRTYYMSAGYSTGHWLWHEALSQALMLGFTLIVVPVTSYLFARCNLSPFSSNRMFPIRLWFSILIAGTLIVSVFQYFFPRVFPFYDDFFLEIWISSTIGVLAAMLVLAVCERETWEGRLRRNIPKAIWRRALVFPLYTGSINGLFWVFLWTIFFIVTFSSFTLVVEYGGVRRSGSFEALWLIRHLVFLIMIFDYSMTAFFLWKTVLRRWIPREMIWALTVGLILLASFGSLFVAFLLQGSLAGVENGMLFAANPFFAFVDDGFELFQAALGIGWFSLIILCGYPWLRNRFLDFTPISPLEATSRSSIDR